MRALGPISYAYQNQSPKTPNESLSIIVWLGIGTILQLDHDRATYSLQCLSTFNRSKCVLEIKFVSY